MKPQKYELFEVLRRLPMNSTFEIRITEIDPILDRPPFEGLMERNPHGFTFIDTDGVIAETEQIPHEAKQASKESADTNG